MSDQRVTALVYGIEPRPSVTYREEGPRNYEEENFSVRIENKEVRFTMKAHYATEEEAKEAVREYIDNWEFTAGLWGGPSVFKLVYRNAKIENQKPVPSPTRWTSTMPEATGTVTYSCPPPPQSGLKITPNVQSMYDRFMGYRSDREPLLGMAYFCLTVLENRPPPPPPQKPRKSRPNGLRAKAAKKHGIDLDVLDKIGRLSSEKGGPLEARKQAGTNDPLTPSETRFLERAIVALIRRAAEVERDPNKSRDEIKLSDFGL